MARRVLVVGVLAVVALAAAACSKDDNTSPSASTRPGADAGAGSAAPKSLDLAKAALASAKVKYAKHEVVDADCAPIRSLEADFAQDKSPDAVKTTHEIDAFCEVDVKLEGEVATLKNDQDKLTAAQLKKDRPSEQMYGATVKDGCTSIREHLQRLVTEHLDGEPKVATSKAEVERICNAPAPAAAPAPPRKKS